MMQMAVEVGDYVQLRGGLKGEVTEVRGGKARVETPWGRHGGKTAVVVEVKDLHIVTRPQVEDR
jgi:preprotein translocase subunit YajC